MGIFDIFAFRNIGILRLKSIFPFSSSLAILHIAYSNLGKAEFYDCKLDEFRAVYIGASQIIDCTFLNMQWPKSIKAYLHQQTDVRLSLARSKERWQKIAELVQSNEAPSVTYYHQREIYRQIKYSLSKQGDTINEQHFHILEMLCYNKMLNWRSNTWTKLIIKISYWTSEFGQSVLKPFLFLIGVHLLWMTCAIFSGALPNLDISLDKLDLHWLSKFIHDFLILINPLHRDRADDFPGWRVFWDVIMRITSSYMIYNIIRATRRFIK